MYSEKTVTDMVNRKIALGMSLRAIAREYGRPITHADIQRASRGTMPKNVAKRRAMGLPDACPVCYRRMPRPPRKVNPRLAAMTDALARLQDAAPKRAPDPFRVYDHNGRRVGPVG